MKNSVEANKVKILHEQIQDRLRHYEAQAQLVETLQKELHSSQVEYQRKLKIRGGIQIIFFLFLHENICCGYSLEVPHHFCMKTYVMGTH